MVVILMLTVQAGPLKGHTYLAKLHFYFDNKA